MIIKYRSSGEVEWAQEIRGDQYDVVNSVAATSDGGYIVGGYFYSKSIDLGNGISLKGNESSTGMVIKYDSEGYAKWGIRIIATLSNSINSVAQINGNSYIVGGQFKDRIDLENGISITSNGTSDGMILKIVDQAGVPEVQELEVTNNRKEFKITTDVKKIDNIKGGSISGEGQRFYEKVKYGDSSINEIKMIPDEGYEIIDITVNGEEYQYTANADGSYTMPTFTSMTENKHVVVTYSLKDNKITINKVDKDTKEKLSGAKFKLDQIEERSEPNSSDIIGTLTDNGTYNFVNNNDKYESTNQGKDSTVANSYIPIDLTNYTGKYNLTVNAEVSSQNNYDYGYATVTENTTAPKYNSSSGRFVYISGTKSAADYTTELQGGKMYYLHLGYYKNASTSKGDDKFTVNSISISLSDSELYHTTVETNSDGQAITQIPFGKYNLTEMQAPDGYVLDSTPKVIEFRGTEGAVHEFTIENEKKAQLVVHHYIKGTTTKLADDENYEGVARDKYTTSPKLDLEKYELEVDSNGEFVLPVNAVGTYKSGVTEVIYYYVEKKIPLTVHHYIEGTTESVPLKAGGTASDVTGTGQEGETYTTSAIADDKLSDEYELVETPSNASGMYSGSEVVVNYYYKKVTRDVNLIKYKEDGVTLLEGAKFTVDGTEYTTNANGRIQTKLEAGTHEIIEVEAPEGYKLPDNPNTSVTITKATTSEDINITNEKKTGTVTVHHYIEGTTNNVPLVDGTLAADETKTGNVGDIYATKAKTNLSEAYELVSEPDNSSGTYIDGNIEVIYYYKSIPATVTVHHYLEGTTTKLADDVTINGLAGDNYTTTAGNVDNKYELVATPSNATGKMTRDGIEVIYYYRLKSTSVLVHYYIEGTTTSLSADKTISGKVDDKYTTTAATDIPSKYQLVATPDNATGTMTVNQIVVIYYYRLKETGVDVHYYKEGTTEKVSADKTITGKVDDKYTTSPATDVPSKYELVETPANASGTMTEDRITVIYYYRLKDTSVLVHHYIEGTTTKLSNDVTIKGQVDDSYETTVASDIPSKYELISTPANASGTMTESQIVVTYYYRLKDTSVLVHHYIKDTTTSLSADVTINGKVDSSYTTTPATNIPEQYELVATPSNASGTMTEDQIVVTYYYQLKSYPYTVNYLEKDTNEVLHEPKQGDELVYGSQVNSADEKINIDGYNYDSADKDVLTIGITNNVINIYYTKRTDLSYTVNYLEKGTNAVLQTPKVQENMTFNDEVLSAGEVIKIDGYNYDSADKVSIKITTGTNVINLYYTKRTDLSYKVNYLEKDTNKVLSPQKIVENKTFDEIITSSTEVIEIDGYNYDSVDKNSLKIGTGENAINIYYTKRTDLSYTVNYLEKETNKVLSNLKVVNNVTFGTTITSINEKIDINGYNYDSADKASITITTGTNVINLYYTKRTDLSYKVNYLEKGTNKVLNNQKTQNGMTFGATVNSVDEKITINGYNFDSYDKDTLSIGTGDNIINIYYTKRTDLSYKVNYLEKTTNKVLHNQKVVENRTFEETITSSTEKIDIDGYNFDSYDKETLTIGTGENVINIYYIKRADLSYTVNYLESVTNKVLHEPKTQENMTFEDVVKAEDEAIKIDGYNYDYPDKYELVIGTSENVLNIYYTKVTGLSYTVNYLEKDTNNVLFPANTTSNMTFGDTVETKDEIIDIDGYKYDSADKDSLTIGTDNNIINIYYTKRTDLSYKVNYLEKDTNKVLNNQKVQTGMTFQSTVDSSKEVITIDGYNFNSYDKATLTIGTGDNIINIYYTKRTDLSYTVNYLEKDTNKVLHEPKVVENVTFETVITSSNEKVDIDGYNYDSVDKATLTIGTGENVINIYYTKKTDLSYKVNYLEKDSNKVLSNQKIVENVTFESVVNSADEKIDIDGYNYDSVDKATLTITTGENVINIYYTKRNDLSYKVNYLEKTTNKILHDQKVQDGMTFETVITLATEVITIDGYNYDSVDKDTLTIGTGENVINIYYTKRNDLSYIVNYLEKDTNNVINPAKTKDGVAFEDEIKSVDEIIPIDGYNYNSVDKDTLTITTGENVINIYYTKRTDLSYKVNYLEKTTNKVLHDQKVVENMTFESTVDSSKEVITIDGYNYDSVDKATLKITTSENVINIYYTKRNDVIYKVNYLEKDTNKVLHDQKVVENMTFESNVTSANEVIDIDGYNYDSVDKDTLTITTGENVINIYYTKKTDLIYKVNYLEKTTNKILHDQKTQDGMTFESVVNSADEKIDIDGYNYDSVDKDTLSITTGENIINIYYTKRTDLSYTVNYLEKTTNKVLHEQKTQDGMTFEDTVDSSKEVIAIDGYNYDSVDKDILSITTGENVINIYYTKRTDLSYTVNYLEKGTNKAIYAPKVTGNMTFEDEITSANEIIPINGYSYDSVDKDKLIITTGANIINIYYTKVQGLAYTVNYLEKDTNKVIHEPKTTDNMAFEDEITSADEAIEIDGYNYDSVDKDTLVIGTGANVINIYYTKRTDLSYKVNYLEKDTNKVLHDQKVVENMTFEDVVTSEDEVIDIDGYKYDSVDKETLTIQASENIINIYYTKRTDLSYTVNYLEKDTNKVIHDQKVVENMTFESVVNSVDEVITIYGYNYDSFDKDTLTITTGENVINIYYTKKDAKVTVHYYEENTTNKVSEDKEITGKVNDEYTTVIADDIPSKYELVAEPNNANGTMTEDDITVIYYFKKKATQVIVRHYEEGTTNKLSQDVVIDGRVDDTYTTTPATDVPIKYELSVTPANANGTMAETTTEVIYYYRVKDAVVNVRYLEKNTDKELAPADKLDGKVDDPYVVGAKVIDGYTMVEHSGNENGKFEVDPITITYYYLYNTRATVQYIDKTTGKILEESTQEGLEGDEFATESKDFTNYILVEEPPQKTVKMTKDEIVLKYYYIHISGGVIEKHIDVISGEILANDTHNGNEGDAYNIPSRTFAGYDLVEDRLPNNASGTMKVDPTEVIYYYIYRTKVTAKYIDRATGNNLTPDVVQDGHEGDAYVTERKTFDDYKLVEVPANADGEMTKKDITVTYNYVHTSGGVIVNHVDVNTNKQLLDETKQEGYEGDPYETHEENIPGYTLVQEKYPANANGTMTIEETRVTYYYVKNTEVNVKYIDKETGEEIAEKTNIPGKEGDNYITEPKDIPGYDLVEEPTNKEGTMTAEPIDVIYYYRRPAKVVIKYIDQETNEEIATEEKQEGHQNDEYTTEAKDIKYYKLIATPDNATGTMKVTVTKDENGKDIVEDTTYVTYYYRKLIFNLNIDKKVSSVTVNGEESIINGDLGKVEVHRKELNTAKVEVKYIIKVTNDSELTGKASILEDIPTGMIMNAEKNAGWEVKGTTATRETKELQPGESEEYLVVLDWENGENNIGMKENTASITSTENEAGFEEKDTTDNEDKADIIVAIGTGGHTYVLIAGGMLLILISLACGAYVVKKVED